MSAIVSTYNIENSIVYPRKSREDMEREKETGEDCLASMTQLLIATCNRYNIPTIEILPEIGSADTIEGRPVFSNIIFNLLPSGKYQAIAVREISRLGRAKYGDAGIIYDTLVNLNIYVVTPHRIYDPSNPADRRAIRMELFMAREEYEYIKERLEYGKDEKAKKGYAPNYLATLGIDTKRGKIIIIPEEAELVVEIFEMRAENKSFKEIADILNGRGLKTKRGTKYHHSTIRKIIHNKRYIGVATWKGKEYPDASPAIVPMELWNRVHQNIEPNRSHNKSNPRDNDYLVELYCHECGKRMYGEMTKSVRTLATGERKVYTEYMVYYCQGRKSTPRCTHSQRGWLIHETVLAELKKIVEDKNTVNAIITDRDNKLAKSEGGLQNRIESLEKKLKQKKQFLLKLDEDYQNGLSPALYSRHYEQTEKEIKSITTELAKKKAQQKNAEIKVDSPDKIINDLKLFLDDWDHLSNRKKKAIIKSFFPRIEIAKDKTFHFYRNLPYTLDV